MSGPYQREQALDREQGQTPLLSISRQVRSQELSTSRAITFAEMELIPLRFISL